MTTVVGDWGETERLTSALVIFKEYGDDFFLLLLSDVTGVRQDFSNGKQWDYVITHNIVYFNLQYWILALLEIWILICK